MNKFYSELSFEDDIEIKRNVDLTTLTTMKLKVFGDLVTLKSLESIKEFQKISNRHNIKFRMVGIGANQIITEGDTIYAKLLLPFDKSYLDTVHEIYKFPASVPLSILVNHAKKNNLKKWEFMTGIPATLGGAVCMNAGISAGEIADLVSKIIIIDKNGNTKVIEKDRNSFSYRSNNFLEDRDIIVEVELLNHGHDEQVKAKIDNYIDLRTKTQPWMDKTCGCIFKNNSKTCRAGHFIDIINLKGLQYKGIKISHLHGNFFINQGDASSSDFIEFIHIVQSELYLQYGINFDFEVQY